MINIGYEQNIAILLPIIVTLNTVFVSGFIDLDSTAMIISNSINLCEERRTKSSRLPLVNQRYVKYMYAIAVVRKLSIGNILKNLAHLKLF